MWCCYLKALYTRIYENIENKIKITLYKNIFSEKTLIFNELEKYKENVWAK